MNANVCTGKRGTEGEDVTDGKVLGTCDRVAFNDNGGRLLTFPDDLELASMDTFCSSPKNGRSCAVPSRVMLRNGSITIS